MLTGILDINAQCGPFAHLITTEKTAALSASGELTFVQTGQEDHFKAPVGYQIGTTDSDSSRTTARSSEIAIFKSPLKPLEKFLKS